MKNAIVDVGSNSVRLLVDGEKISEVTHLAEDLLRSGRLKPEAIERTVAAIRRFAGVARKRGAQSVYAFGTEAVRAAENRDEFLLAVRGAADSFEVIPPEKEAELGFLGAYDGAGKAGVLDVGGASTELAVGDASGICFARSLPLGAVRLSEYATDEKTQFGYAKQVVSEYKDAPLFDGLISIGGCVSVMAAVFLEMEPYDSDRIHGYTMRLEDLRETVRRVLAVPEKERVGIKGLHPKRIVVGPVGALIAIAAMEQLGKTEITLSERGNMEGYAAWRGIRL